MYELVHDMNTRQDKLEERLASLEEKLTSLQEQLELLPEALTRCIAQHAERMEQRRNFLHPDTAVALVTPASGGGGGGVSSLGNTSLFSSAQCFNLSLRGSATLDIFIFIF